MKVFKFIGIQLLKVICFIPWVLSIAIGVLIIGFYLVVSLPFEDMPIKFSLKTVYNEDLDVLVEDAAKEEVVEVKEEVKEEVVIKKKRAPRKKAQIIEPGVEIIEKF